MASKIPFVRPRAEWWLLLSRWCAEHMAYRSSNLHDERIIGRLVGGLPHGSCHSDFLKKSHFWSFVCNISIGILSEVRSFHRREKQSISSKATWRSINSQHPKFTQGRVSSLHLELIFLIIHIAHFQSSFEPLISVECFMRIASWWWDFIVSGTSQFSSSEKKTLTELKRRSRSPVNAPLSIAMVRVMTIKAAW